MSVQFLTVSNQALSEDELALAENKQAQEQKAPFMLFNENLSL